MTHKNDYRYQFLKNSKPLKICYDELIFQAANVKNKKKLSTLLLFYTHSKYYFSNTDEKKVGDE